MNYTEYGKKFLVVTFGALLVAIGMNMFLIPANVYASGFAGLAQLLSKLLEGVAPFLSPGIVLIILNAPIILVAWNKIGKTFTFFSFISVGMMTVFLELVPTTVNFSDDILLNAVFGGVIMAVGVGLTLKYGASTGGLDVIAMIMSRMNDKSVGTYFFLFNALIVITTGAIFEWETALYTLISLYVTTRVLDAIYTSHVKVTAFIITSKPEELREAIHNTLVRGITRMPAQGAYTNEQKEVLMIVVTRYELYDLQKLIQEVDPEAFTNIVETVGVLGLFRKS
ncbi:YitT family protein [Priestia taiwanensis]|uniref:Membrane protein n=1 Tax=Priestia taiwanensis TaxID=1347902 RepID=A0A917AV19_9BACI|nr:YitT family protein [Priestia taiwanensis]MBM7364189.1 uncharacterized membrane-anchored protein YitT (DUF2179 family) [Priestia taiwanensis]GGE72364.1 membrane protein [Priestia taiwanensis]